MGMYEFKESDAYAFANHVHIQTKKRGEELQFIHCPYCKGGNSGKDKGTFSINLRTGQYKCLRSSCGVSGNMITLSQDFDFSLGRDNDEYLYKKKQYRKLPTPKEPIKPKNSAIEYLNKRGISKEVAEKYEITVMNKNDNILVFPFFDENGKMQFVKYRNMNFDKTKDKNKEWCEANCKPILFGMKQCTDFSRLILCEGQIDSLSVSACGIDNAVSVPTGANGFTWIPYCWDWVNKFEEIVIFGDYENGHITLLDEIKKRFKTKIKHVREEDYKDCKDANEILLKYGKEQVGKCVENAILVPIKRVINLADVVPVNPYSIPKISTGIKDIDKLLHGGLPLGGVALITGKTGKGKSTFASQILINAVEKGFTCFAYSGELSSFSFQRTIDYQVAGSRHIQEHTADSYGGIEYDISESNKNRIHDWYSNKIYLYDNTYIDDEEQNLISIIEDVIMQYGVNVILLDNLMTAMSLQKVRGVDKFDRQSEFMNKLAKLSLKHNVLIMLVAHMRKNNYSSDKNDEISGSGDVPNLASVIISYTSDSEIKEEQRIATLSKNRLFGETNEKGFVLDFDVKSKRIYGKNDNKDVEYSWNTEIADTNNETVVNSNDNGFTNIEVNDNNPFD